MRNKAVFLDRDGVINRDDGYVYLWRDFVLLDGVVEALKNIQSKNYLIFIVTNQSGIARGFYRESDVEKLHQNLKDEFFLYGINIAGIRFCPHHPEGVIVRYTVDCNCRKPRPGMLYELGESFNVDFAKSYMIGDKESDVYAGTHAGIKNSYLLGDERGDFNSLLSFSLFLP